MDKTDKKVMKIYENMLNEERVEIEATLDSIGEYLFLFGDSLKKGTLTGKKKYAISKLRDLKTSISKLEKSILNYKE